MYQRCLMVLWEHRGETLHSAWNCCRWPPREGAVSDESWDGVWQATKAGRCTSLRGGASYATGRGSREFRNCEHFSGTIRQGRAQVTRQGRNEPRNRSRNQTTTKVVCNSKEAEFYTGPLYSSAGSVPGIQLSVTDTAVSRSHMIPVLGELTFQQGRQTRHKWLFNRYKNN